MLGAMTDLYLPRPTTGDVVDLILDDHRLFEDLLRQLRDATADREAARGALAAVLIAHGEAEEAEVYPQLVRKDAIERPTRPSTARSEHAEGNEALLALLECQGTDTQKFDDAVEDLATALNHHIGEEEQTILNPARTDVDARPAQRLGLAFATARNQLLDGGAGSIDERPRDRRARPSGRASCRRRRGEE